MMWELAGIRFYLDNIFLDLFPEYLHTQYTPVGDKEAKFVVDFKTN